MLADRHHPPRRARRRGAHPAPVSYRLPALLAAALLVAGGAGCTSSSRHRSADTPTGVATVRQVGDAITVSVTPDRTLSVDVPHVGHIAGPAGSFTAAGSITITPKAAQFADGTGLASAGDGVDVAFHGTALRAPLTLTFDTGARSGDVQPVLAHQADDGSWDVTPAQVDATGHLVASTQSFSLNLPSWANPVNWWHGLQAKMASAVGGRTAPLDCSGAPGWFHLNDVHSGLVHSCAMTNHLGDGTEVAEVQIKSNRGVTLQVDVPGQPSYVWVEGTTWAGRQALASKLGQDPNRTVLLPAGKTMTVGYTRPSGSTAPVSFFVTGTTTPAVVDTALRDIIDFALGKLDPTVLAYAEVKCSTALSRGLGGVDHGVASWHEWLTCLTGSVLGELRDTQTAVSWATQFGGPDFTKSSHEAQKKAVDELVAHARALKALGWLVTLWPVYQVGIGNDLDKIDELLTNGESAQVTYHVDPKPVAWGGDSNPPPPQAQPQQPQPQPQTHAVTLYDNYGDVTTAGHSMCRGNPNAPTSMPGGEVTQTFTVPSGATAITTALVQIDPGPITVAARMLDGGTQLGSASAAAAGDTTFNFGQVGVIPGHTLALVLNWSATSGTINTVYTVGSPGGTFHSSNNCPANHQSDTTSAGLRARIAGLGY